MLIVLKDPCQFEPPSPCIATLYVHTVHDYMKNVLETRPLCSRVASYPVSTASFFLHVGKKEAAVETGYEATQGRVQQNTL